MESKIKQLLSFTNAKYYTTITKNVTNFRIKEKCMQIQKKNNKEQTNPDSTPAKETPAATQNTNLPDEETIN